MQRRKFIGSLTGGAVIGPLAIAAAEEKEVERQLVTTPAVLMAPRHDGAEVVWAVSELSRGWVEWKGEDGLVKRASADRFGLVPQSENVLRVRLTDMKPGVTYEWRAVTVASSGGQRHESPWKPFRTLDGAADSSRFVVWNDTHENVDTIRKLHQVTPSADFLIWNGDTCNDWHREGDLVPILLNPGGEDVSAERPLFFVWGNHDVRGKWAYKMPQTVATPFGRPYYAFRSGPVAVICLHTGEDKPDAHPSFGGRVAFEALRKEQAGWLKEITAKPEIRDAPYRVVVCHIPLRWTTEVAEVAYDQGGYDIFSKFSRDAWHDSLVAWKAQVIISGHTHRSALIPANREFPYAQLTGGGPQLERATFVDARADMEAFVLSVKNLDGRTLEELVLKPLVHRSPSDCAFGIDKIELAE
jgi:predicted phosphodiesterase